VADFSAGDLAGGALEVADQVDGEVRRVALFEDYFDAATSAARWIWGSWDNSIFIPSPSGGQLVVRGPNNSAFPRSLTSYGPQTLEARVTFGSGPWEHVGFADDGFGSRWAILSTAETSDTIFARTYVSCSNCAEQRTALTGVALGTPHDVR